VLAGAVALAWSPGAGAATLAGAAAVAGACFCWALDNNLTQRLSARDPHTVVAWKGLGASLCALTIAMAVRAPGAPSARAIVAGLLLGALSYGTSLVLYVRALRELGAARTGLLFAAAPFFGALVAIVVLGERPGARTGLVGLGMAVGLWLFLSEHHEHEHSHDELEHEHAHRHDEHHQHEHAGGEGPEPHTHRHRHGRLVHSHGHVSDAHHRHSH
jgi:drug/metabolite transporter (DMT)-like permease